MEHRAPILRITMAAVPLWILAVVLAANTNAHALASPGATSAAPVTLAPLNAGFVTLADPPSINDLSNATSLTAANRTKIKDYARYWTAKLVEAAQSPESVKNIRLKLNGPLERGNPSEVFRTEYGSALKSGLVEVIELGNPHTCVVAMIVLSKLGTESALEQLVDRCGLPGESRRHVRLAAARGCRQMFDSGALDQAKPNKITSAARGLSKAAQFETDRFTLHHQLEALIAADRRTLSASPRAQIHTSLVTALESTAKRANAAKADADPSTLDLLDATYPVLNRLRFAFLDPDNLPPTMQKEFGKKLGPCLGQMLEVAKVHWGDVQNSPGSKKQFGRIVNICEIFLNTIDPFVRPNQGSLNTNLANAWGAGDINGYSRDLQRWQNVLRQPPY